MLIWIHVAAIFYVLYALAGFYLQIKYHIDWDTQKQKYQLHRLIRFAFASFATTVFLILFLPNSYELHWAFIISAVCTIIFFFSKRRYSKLFVENPKKKQYDFRDRKFCDYDASFVSPTLGIALFSRTKLR